MRSLLLGLIFASALVCATAPDLAAQERTRAPVRGGITTADGSQLWPILPPYPYRSGYYPKADWYHDIPPYVSIEPSFYRRRYFMIGQEGDRYRFVPHIFSGDRYRGGAITSVNMRNITTTLKNPAAEPTTDSEPTTPVPPTQPMTNPGRNPQQ
jgi:hypothetical protein